MIKNFWKSCDEGELLEIAFDENLKNNYLKAVSNIYFLNLRKIQIKIQNEIKTNNLTFKDDRAVFMRVQSIYNEVLKETRVIVCNFFNIKETCDLSLKIMMRLYYYYLPKNDSRRFKMDLINFQINYILDRLSLGYKFNIFLDDNHPKAVTEPVDV